MAAPGSGRRVPSGESDLGLRFYTWKPTDLKLQEERFKFQRGDQVESSLAELLRSVNKLYKEGQIHGLPLVHYFTILSVLSFLMLL